MILSNLYTSRKARVRGNLFDLPISYFTGLPRGIFGDRGGGITTFSQELPYDFDRNDGDGPGPQAVGVPSVSFIKKTLKKREKEKQVETDHPTF
jgi:hypothetical protein